MKRAQGALEYLIIIAVVLGISAVVVMTMTSTFSGQSSSTYIAACKQTATECKVSHTVSPNDPCLNCIDACKNQITGQEVFSGATVCCQNEMTENIYADSPGCGILCGNGQVNFGEECDDGNLLATDGCSPTCTIEGNCGDHGLTCPDDWICCISNYDNTDECCDPLMFYPNYPTYCAHDNNGDAVCFWDSVFPK